MCQKNHKFTPFGKIFVIHVENQDFFPKMDKKTLSSGNNPELGLLNYISRV